MHRTHLPEWQSRTVVQSLLNLCNDRERNRGRGFRAEVESGGGVHMRQPFLGALRRIRQFELFGRLSQNLERSPLRAEHANISRLHFTRKQTSEYMRVLLE